MKIRNFFAAGAAVLMMCSVCSAQDITVNVDGVKVDFPAQQPIIQDGRTLIPLRGVFDTLGYDIFWAGDTKTVTIEKENTVITIVIGQKNYYYNGVSHDIDVPAQIINGSTMLPLRAIAEAAGLGVVWNSEEKTAVLMSDNTGDTSKTVSVELGSVEDQKFADELFDIANNFDTAVKNYNEVLDWVSEAGIHGEEDYKKVADAAAEMKKAADEAGSRLRPLICTEKLGALKNAYLKYIGYTAENADVVYKYFSGEMPSEEFAEKLDDTLAKSYSAETEYNSLLEELALQSR